MESALRLLGSESRETARSKMESSTLCLEVPNNGLAIVGEKRCSLALFIRQRSWLSMKCILWQHDRFIYVVFAKLNMHALFIIKLPTLDWHVFDGSSVKIAFCFQKILHIYP